MGRPGNLIWKLYRYRPHALTGILMAGVNSAGLYLLIFLGRPNVTFSGIDSITGLDGSLWFLIVMTVIGCMAGTYEVGKELLSNYIVEIIFKKNVLEILYRKGNGKSIPYEESGFVHFSISEGMMLHKRFCPSFSFYRKDASSKVLDDVLYKKGYQIFKGDISHKEDYLILKNFWMIKESISMNPEKLWIFLIGMHGDGLCNIQSENLWFYIWWDNNPEMLTQKEKYVEGIGREIQK